MKPATAFSSQRARPHADHTPGENDTTPTGSASLAWASHGLCASSLARGLPWTTDTHLLPTVLIDVMADTCAACPVQAACADYAATQAVMGGFWAGSDRNARGPGGTEPDASGWGRRQGLLFTINHVEDADGRCGSPGLVA